MDPTPDPAPVKVEIFFPETEFGGVQIFGATDTPIQVEFNTGSPVLSVFGRVGNVTAQCSDYDQCYASLERGLPGGGLTGQHLAKRTDLPFDTIWVPADVLTAPSTFNLFSGDNLGGIIDSGIPVTDVARISLPNVFQQVNTIPGLRLSTRHINTDSPMSVVNFASIVDASASPRTVPLPQALGTSQIFYAQKRDNSVNTVTVQPEPGDKINGQDSWILSNQWDDVALIDSAVGEWTKFGAGTGEIPPVIDLTDFARLSMPNVFLNFNTFPGVRFSPVTMIDDFSFTPLNFGVMIDCSVNSKSINGQLPQATGSGQLYYAEKADATDFVGSIKRFGTDVIGRDGAVSVDFVEKGSNVLLYDSQPGYWSIIGPDVEGGGASDFGENFRIRDLSPIHGVAFEVRDIDDTTWIEQVRYTEPSTGPTPISDVSIFWRPEINNNTDVAAFPSIGLLENSRLDCYFTGQGEVHFLRRIGAADPGDPGQVAPDDYDAGDNDFHWEKIL